MVIEAAEYNGAYAAMKSPTNTELGPSAAKKPKKLTQQTPTFDFTHITNAADLPGPSTRPDVTPLTIDDNDNSPAPLTEDLPTANSPTITDDNSHLTSTNSTVTNCPYSL
ncbi:unnamed protein product [Anisakis simplex]|uniref:Uncharacterized protein n=1 Tax=Anisakis simplex TaxID=6269 RepID=A0A3P6PZS2_ANISI|nr:unnamed protein product [Anisakis simplex]